METDSRSCTAGNLKRGGLGFFFGYSVLMQETIELNWPGVRVALD